MFSNNINKLNQALKKYSVTAGSSSKRLASSFHTTHVFHKHPFNVEVENRSEEDIRINKIPNIKGFEILRNPKLNKGKKKKKCLIIKHSTDVWIFESIFLEVKL